MTGLDFDLVFAEVVDFAFGAAAAAAVLEGEEKPCARLSPSASAKRFCRSSLLPWSDMLGWRNLIVFFKPSTVKLAIKTSERFL